jgi:hypothetical protein
MMQLRRPRYGITYAPGVQPKTAKVRDLTAGNRVRMYHTVIEVTEPWHVPAGEQLREGWGRLPMIWDGTRCAPAEDGDRLVELETIFRVENGHGQTVLETDDWVDAQKTAIDAMRRSVLLSVHGTHPTHHWDTRQSPPRCRDCGSWDNGSYGSQSPCGYDWNRASLTDALTNELAKRAQEAP